MYRIIYKSRSVEALNWDIVRSITNASEINNEACGLTGVLLASRSHFLQTIEGRFVACPWRIRNSSRHR